MMLCIDRFEEDFAVCEKDGGEMIKIKRALIPEDAREGDVIYYDDAAHRYILDENETARRRKEITKLQDELFS